MKRLAILASGSGSNAQQIINYFKDSTDIEVAVIGSNRKEAFVLERGKKENIPTFAFSNGELKSGLVLEELQKLDINFIILAGFLALIPGELVQAFPDQIINIHPSLLPKYGGKGMYGKHVHQAVKEAAEAYSGPTIHLVNEEFDKGKVLFQATVKLQEEDTAEEIAAKVLQLEHRYFAAVVESYLCFK